MVAVNRPLRQSDLTRERQELFHSNPPTWAARSLKFHRNSNLSHAPERGRRPCAVLCAPWRGLSERSWFGASFFSGQHVLHLLFISAFVEPLCAPEPVGGKPALPISATVQQIDGCMFQPNE